MSEAEKRHVDDKLQAWLDGELSENEGEKIRSHVDSCAQCSRALRETEATLEALRKYEDAVPLRPMWPAVRAGMAAAARPRFGLSFGFVTSAAAAAGLIIGIMLGTPGRSSAPTGENGSEYSVESALEDGAVMTLDEMYVSAFSEDGEDL